MNLEGLEVRINKQYKTITYWKDGVMVGRRCTKCGKDKEISNFHFINKKKGTYQPKCKECCKRWQNDNIEKLKEYKKEYRNKNKEHIKELQKQWRINNAEHIKETQKKYRIENAEQLREKTRQYRLKNPEHNKQWYRKNIKHRKEYGKQYRTNAKEINLQNISNILEQINPVIKKLPIYGYIYKFENIKTKRVYIGQTITLLKYRYGIDVIKKWIEERKHYENQKFLDELIEEDFIVTEVLDVGFCEYHLNILEAYWINYYDSCNNGYNNYAGNHKSDDGIEEFNQILSTHNLQYIDGKIIKAPTDR